LTDFPYIDMPEDEPVGVQRGCYFSVLLQPINPCAISFDRDDLAGLRLYRGKRAAT
jgi:CO dehydrogenase/acetyl-CoA synthase beta subunit